MNISKPMLLFILSFCIGSAQAGILKCVGVDKASGTTLNVIYNSDPKIKTININGVDRAIEAPTKDRTGLATANYTTANNVLVYDSFIKTADGYNLHRFNAMTEETIFDDPLMCTIQK